MDKMEECIYDKDVTTEKLECNASMSRIGKYIFTFYKESTENVRAIK